MLNTNKIILEIESFKPVDGNWLPLDSLLNDLWETGNPQLGINALFKIFERFPFDDGIGTLLGKR
ncbi:hypothetical protein [Aquimarina sp. SS2-1]|uniref:hypothetical protein n=1 Tax=Aquimarina besae TaxID=3342247 RepID=UPI003670EB0A